MFAALVTTLCLAPVPPAPPVADPIVPGFRWWYVSSDVGYELEVVRVDGDHVTYRCVNGYCPWCGCQESGEPRGRQDKATTLAEWRRYGSPRVRWKPLVSPEW